MEDIWPLSPLQEGLFFHATYDDGALDVYTVHEPSTSPTASTPTGCARPCAALLARNPSLRAGFTSDGLRQPVQFIVRRRRDPARRGRPLRAARRRTGPRGCAELLAAERARRFDLARPLLFRLLLVRLGDERGDRLVVGRHLLLWDGWSAWLFLDQLFALYETAGDAGAACPLPAPTATT